jgi:hypothetical protein
MGGLLRSALRDEKRAIILFLTLEADKSLVYLYVIRSTKPISAKAHLHELRAVVRERDEVTSGFQKIRYCISLGEFRWAQHA